MASNMGMTPFNSTKYVPKENGQNGPAIRKPGIQNAIIPENGLDKLDLHSLYNLFPPAQESPPASSPGSTSGPGFHQSGGLHTNHSIPNSPEEKQADLVKALTSQDEGWVQQLIKAGVNVNAIDKSSGYSMLELAAINGDANNVQALINSVPEEQRKDFVNKQNDGTGQTALFKAGLANHADVVNALIQAGADTNIKDNAGSTAYEYTKKYTQNVAPNLLQTLSPTVMVDGVNGVKIQTAGMSDDEINNVKDYVKFLSQDADGSKLLKAASKGGEITIGYDLSFQGDLGGVTGEHHISLSKGVIDNEEKAQDPGDPGNIMGMSTIAHEFVHAATWADGDSKQEEALAEAIGTRVAGRYYNKPIDEQKIYDAWIANAAYNDQQADNGIFDNVSNLGIDVSNVHKHD